jgi:hypothetical protein
VRSLEGSTERGARVRSTEARPDSAGPRGRTAASTGTAQRLTVMTLEGLPSSTLAAAHTSWAGWAAPAGVFGQVTRRRARTTVATTETRKGPLRRNIVRDHPISMATDSSTTLRRMSSRRLKQGCQRQTRERQGWPFPLPMTDDQAPASIASNPHAAPRRSPPRAAPGAPPRITDAGVEPVLPQTLEPTPHVRNNKPRPGRGCVALSWTGTHSDV